MLAHGSLKFLQSHILLSQNSHLNSSLQRLNNQLYGLRLGEDTRWNLVSTTLRSDGMRRAIRAEKELRVSGSCSM